MLHKSETRAGKARASRNSCGGRFRESYIPSDHCEQTLAFHVREFAPDAHGDELKYRVSLLKARDYAAGLLGNAVANRAYDHAQDAHEMAGRFVFADVPTIRLGIVLAYCRHMVMAAYLAEHLDSELNGR